MKRNTRKKGFTIVELVIVIAAIAILTAVMIPTFSAISKKAKISSDTQVVKMLNTSMSSVVNQDNPKTMTEALAIAAENGFNVEKLSAKEKTSKILWDSVNNVYCYLKEGQTEPEYDEVGVQKKKSPVKDWEYWVISKTVDTKYSTYYIGTDPGTETNPIVATKGFDAGTANVAYLKYENTTDKAQENVVIRTNGGSLTINAASDTVHHYNDVDKVDIQAINTASYHENGKVAVSMKVSNGHVVVEQKGYVNELTIPSDAVSTSVDIKPTGEVNTAVVDSSTATVVVAQGAEINQIVGATTNISGAGSEVAKANAVVKVEVSNETELKNALDAQKPYIVLIDDISITAASEAIDAQGVAKGETGNGYKGLLLNYNVSIDGGNHKLTFANSSSRGLVINAEGIKVNIKNLTTKNADRGIQMSAPNCTLVADGWVSENIGHYVLNVATIALNPNVTITNSVLTGYGVLNFWASGYSVYVSNSELYGVNNASYNAAGWNDFGTVILEGDTTLQTTDHSSTIDVNIINSKISATTTGQGNKQWCILFNTGCVSNNVNLSGCTLVYNKNQNTFLLLDDGEGNSLFVDGTKIVE